MATTKKPATKQNKKETVSEKPEKTTAGKKNTPEQKEPKEKKEPKAKTTKVASTDGTAPAKPVRNRTTIKPVVSPADNSNGAVNSTNENPNPEEQLNLIAPEEETTTHTTQQHEDDDIAASIIAPESDDDKQEVLSPAKQKVTTSQPNTATPAAKEKVSGEQPKEKVIFTGGADPKNKEYEDMLRKHMTPIVNYLVQHKKGFNVFKETVDACLASNGAPGFTYTYDAGAGIITGNYMGRVEIKTPFEVTAHPKS